jgi:hypothetical protein
VIVPPTEHRYALMRAWSHCICFRGLCARELLVRARRISWGCAGLRLRSGRVRTTRTLAFNVGNSCLSGPGQAHPERQHGQIPDVCSAITRNSRRGRVAIIDLSSCLLSGWSVQESTSDHSRDLS